MFTFFHSNLSFPPSRSSRQPARWSRHREAEKGKMKSSTSLPWQKKKTRQNAAENRPGPSPPCRGWVHRSLIFLISFFFYPSACNSGFLIIPNCLSFLAEDAGWPCRCTTTGEMLKNLLSGYLSTCSSPFFPLDGKKVIYRGMTLFLSWQRRYK